MYKNATPYVIYGFRDGDRCEMLDKNWLIANYPSLDIYALDIVRLHVGDVVYGIPAEFDEETGEATISEEKKSRVKKLYKKFKLMKKQEAAGKSKGKKSSKGKEEEEEEETEELGFHTCLSLSTAEISQSLYVITEDNEKRIVREEKIISREEMFQKLLMGASGRF